MTAVRYAVPLIAQQRAMSCWAASATMIWSWANRQSVDPRTLAVDSGFQRQYDQDQGMDISQADPVLVAWGLVREQPQSYSLSGFLNLLQQYGPLMVSAWVNLGGTATVANHTRVTQ